MKIQDIKIKTLKVNQYIISDKTNNTEYLQSYDSIIAAKQYCKDGIIVCLDINYWDYSTTTGKYRNQFLGEGIAETRQKIKEGIYILTDLNK